MVREAFPSTLMGCRVEDGSSYGLKRPTQMLYYVFEIRHLVNQQQNVTKSRGKYCCHPGQNFPRLERYFFYP